MIGSDWQENEEINSKLVVSYAISLHVLTNGNNAVTLIAESPESAESSPMQHVIIEATAT